MIHSLSSTSARFVAGDPSPLRRLRARATTNVVSFSYRPARLLERFQSARILSATEAKENTVARLPQDKDRIERATREAQSIIAIEREAREAKTARLREQRLSSEAPASAGATAAKRKPGARKATHKTPDAR